MIKDLISRLAIIGKKTLDLILWDALRIRRPKYRHRQGGGVNRYDPPTMPTFRTYSLGGDPFSDRIEFFLTDGSTAGGFGDPVPDREVRKINPPLTEAEIRAAFGVPER